MEKRQEGGVIIVLPKGATVPPFIPVGNDGIAVSEGMFEGHAVTLLTIPGGDAEFIPGGQVAIRLRGKRNDIVAFQSDVVCVILDSTGITRERNRRLCPNCWDFTRVLMPDSGDSLGPGHLRTREYLCTSCGVSQGMVC